MPTYLAGTKSSGNILSAQHVTRLCGQAPITPRALPPVAAVQAGVSRALYGSPKPVAALLPSRDTAALDAVADDGKVYTYRDPSADHISWHLETVSRSDASLLDEIAPARETKRESPYGLTIVDLNAAVNAAVWSPLGRARIRQDMELEFAAAAAYAKGVMAAEREDARALRELFARHPALRNESVKRDIVVMATYGLVRSEARPRAPFAIVTEESKQAVANYMTRLCANPDAQPAFSADKDSTDDMIFKAAFETPYRLVQESETKAGLYVRLCPGAAEWIAQAAAENLRRKLGDLGARARRVPLAKLTGALRYAVRLHTASETHRVATETHRRERPASAALAA